MVFTLQSIKSRIETEGVYDSKNKQRMFLLYSPLNQGLKHLRDADLRWANLRVFTLQSIKSRIETHLCRMDVQACPGFYSTVH